MKSPGGSGFNFAKCLFENGAVRVSGPNPWSEAQSLKTKKPRLT